MRTHNLLILSILFFSASCSSINSAKKWNYQSERSQKLNKIHKKYIKELNTELKRDYYNQHYIKNITLRLLIGELKEDTIGECRERVVFVNKRYINKTINLLQFCANQDFNENYYFNYYNELDSQEEI